MTNSLICEAKSRVIRLISVTSRSKSNEIFVSKLLMKLRNLWGQLFDNKVNAVYVKEGLF